MSSIVRLKETETTTEMFEFLQTTVYAGLGKTEILRAILAEKTWEIKSQLLKNEQYSLSPITKAKLQNSYNNYKQGKSTLVKNQDIEEFVENL